MKTLKFIQNEMTASFAFFQRTTIVSAILYFWSIYRNEKSFSIIWLSIIWVSTVYARQSKLRSVASYIVLQSYAGFTSDGADNISQSIQVFLLSFFCCRFNFFSYSFSLNFLHRLYRIYISFENITVYILIAMFLIS